MLSLVLTLAVAAQSIAANPSTTPTPAEWEQGVDQIVRDLRSYHPAPFTKVGELTFMRESQRLRRALPTLTEEQRVVGAMRLVASIGDGHTRLEMNQARFAAWYPLRIYEFTDGYFIVSAHPSVKELAGAQVLEIGGHPIAEVAEAARSVISADNDSQRRENLYALSAATLMKGLGYAKENGDLTIKVRLHSGGIVERTLVPHATDDPDFKGNGATFEWTYSGEMFGPPFGDRDKWVSGYQNLTAGAFKVADGKRPPHLSQRAAFYARALPEQSAFYIQVNLMDDTDLAPSIKAALATVDTLKPRSLIIDLRYNFGGDGSQVWSTIQEFVRRSPETPWKSLYILTGRKTFSAAIMLLHGFMTHVPITIVGEPAGAALNSYGDAIEVQYPRLGLRLSVSTLRHQLGASDDLSEAILVDVPARFSFADYSAGRDPAVDPILKGDEMRSLSLIARTDGGSAARRVWLDRQQRFAAVAGWGSPSEIDLRNACRDLAEANRPDDAIATCKLSAEIHPFEWHSWFNVGLLLRRLKVREGLAYYRCANLVDPTNQNADAMNEVLRKNNAEDIALPTGCPAAK